jgi:very-short-patch-repair endonuclease
MTQQHRFDKQLRKYSTDTERFLWSKLRNKRFEGLKFRRQEPIGKYIVDFVCYEKKLIIECDGSQHIANEKKDKIRDEYLKKQGFYVLRFWDTDVLQNIDGVLEVIFKATKEPFSPGLRPSPP